ncbi:MAG: hypothetical protein MUP76_04775 [Acidimicrobiia bacterium]|nr:hypothetical protein [Acidimicrobiia bacterium]
MRLPTVKANEAGKAQGWQSAAWGFYDSVAELNYLSNWIGNVLSRAELHAAKRDGNALVPMTEGPGREAMEALYGGPVGQAQMLQLLGVDTTVSGEGYIVARGDDEWDVLTTGKVTQAADKTITANFGDGHSRVILGGDDLVIRVWMPHPTNPRQADAPTRANLRTLAQINGYDDHISAQLTSRLAGAGILIMPSEIQFAAPAEGDPEATQASTFMATLAEAMEAAKAAPGSPATFVPIVVTAPGEFIDAIKHLTFWSDLDDKVINMRESAIQRFAIGMDVPPETLMGNSDSNHWNAWLTEESAIKAHLEPRLGVITAALTTAYLRPALTGVVPDSELADWFVVADTTNIRVRPNKAADSMELHDRGLINGEAVRRETGFRPEDKMEPDEFSNWLLQRIAQGAVTPELTAEALRLLGANIDISVIMPDSMQQPPDHIRSDTVVAPNPMSPPTAAPDGALLAACSVLVFRALERAGNRLRNQHPRTDTQKMSVHQVYTVLGGDADHLLDGAWDCAPEVLQDFDVDVPEVVGLLDFYVRGLLSQKREPNPSTLRHLLTSSHMKAIETTS